MQETREENYKTFRKQIKNTKLLPSPSIIILNVNVLNSPINIQRLAEWLKTDKVMSEL